MAQPPPDSDQPGGQNLDYPYIQQQSQQANTIKKKAKKWPWIVGVIIVIFLVSAVAGGGDKDKKENAASTTPSASQTVVASPAGVTTPVKVLAQAPQSTTTVAPKPAQPQISASQQNAARSANRYLDMIAFSRSGLIEQLEFEDFSTSDAIYAVDSLGADWNEQAALSAKKYLEMTSFSRSGLIEQLEFEGYTSEQAEYGADAAY